MNWMGGARSLHTKNDGSRRRQQRHYTKIKNRMRTGNIRSSQQSESNWRPSFLVPGDPRLKKEDDQESGSSQGFRDRWGYKDEEKEKPARKTSITGIVGLGRGDCITREMAYDDPRSRELIAEAGSRNSEQAKTTGFKESTWSQLRADNQRPMHRKGDLNILISTSLPKSSSSSLSKRQTSLSEFSQLAPVVNRLKNIGKSNLERPERTNARKAEQLRKNGLEEMDLGVKVTDTRKWNHKFDISDNEIAQDGVGDMNEEESRMGYVDDGYEPSQTHDSSCKASIMRNSKRKAQSTLEFDERKRRLLAQPDWAGLRFAKSVKMDFPILKKPGFSKSSRSRPDTNPQSRHVIEHRPGFQLPERRRARGEDNPVMSGALPIAQSVINIRIGDDALKSTQQSYVIEQNRSSFASNDSMLLDTLLRTPHSSPKFDTFEPVFLQQGSASKDEYPQAQPWMHPEITSAATLLSHSHSVDLNHQAQSSRVPVYQQKHKSQQQTTLEKLNQGRFKDANRLIFTDTPSTTYNPPNLRLESRRELSIDENPWSRLHRTANSFMGKHEESRISPNVCHRLAEGNKYASGPLIEQSHLHADVQSTKSIAGNLNSEAKGSDTHPSIAQNTITAQENNDDYFAWCNFIGIGQNDSDDEQNKPRGCLGHVHGHDGSGLQDIFLKNMSDFSSNGHGYDQSEPVSLTPLSRSLPSPKLSSISSSYHDTYDITASARVAAAKLDPRELDQLCPGFTAMPGSWKSGQPSLPSSMQPFHPQSPLVTSGLPSAQVYSERLVPGRAARTVPRSVPYGVTKQCDVDNHQHHRQAGPRDHKHHGQTEVVNSSMLAADGSALPGLELDQE
jgi:hypothetical protein